jgi:undecaprenyl-diphosphatase
MEFFAKIIGIDIAVFKFINITLYNRYIAAAVMFFANDITVVVLLGAGLFYLARHYGEKEKANLCAGLWAVIITNLVCNFLVKPVFHRPRPVVTVDGMHPLAWVLKSSFSFPSTHTAMATAIAVVLWNDYKELRPWITAFVAGLAFFCVYTGGHYPLDVLAGFLLGMITGTAMDIFKNRVLKSR